MFVNITEKPPWGSVIKAITITITCMVVAYSAGISLLFPSVMLSQLHNIEYSTE